MVQTNHHLYNYRSEREGSAMNTLDLNYSANLKSILIILNLLGSMKLMILSKHTLNIIKVSFWKDLLYYFDSYKTTLTSKKILSISNDLYKITGNLKRISSADIDINFDILIYNLFKSNYLFLRYNSIVSFLRNCVVKTNLILKK